MARGPAWPSRKIPSRPFPERAAAEHRPPGRRREVVATCPACGEQVSAQACSAGEPDQASAAALADLALALHRRGGCAGALPDAG